MAFYVKTFFDELNERGRMGYGDNASLPSSREEARAVVAESVSAPVGSEQTIEYELFVTDPGIDGYSDEDSNAADVINDDFYRTSNVSMSGEMMLSRQLTEKEERPATIRLIRRLSTEEMTHSAGTSGLPWVNIIPPNTKFFLESVQENREEKVQVMDTFGEFVAFFFGRRPEVYQYSGTLLNAKNHDWKNEFQENYEYFLRGSQAVKHRATMILQYDDVMVEGYMMSCQIQQSAMADKSVPFSFNLLVLNRSPINPRKQLMNRFNRSGLSISEKELFNSMQNTFLSYGSKSKSSDELSTFLLLREHLVGNILPSAGTAVITNTNSVQSESSKVPNSYAGALPTAASASRIGR